MFHLYAHLHDFDRHDLYLFRLHGMWGMYVNHFFRVMSTMIIGLYVPIYLYQHLGSYDFLFMYYLLIYFWSLVWLPMVVMVMRHWGVDRSLALASAMRATAIFMFPLIVSNPRWALGVALFNGMTIAFDWIPYHYSVTALTKKAGNFGRNSSFVSIVEKLAEVLGPTFGAVIITYLGYTWLYMTSGVLLLFAALAPFFDEFDHKLMHFQWKEIGMRFMDRGIIKHFIGHGLNVFDVNAYSIIWPLILIASFGTVMRSGLFQSAMMLSSLMVLFWLSKYLDRGNYGVMKLGAVFNFSHWWLRYLFVNPFGLAVAEILNSIGQVLVWTPFNALIYLKAAQGYKLEFFCVRHIIRMSLSIVAVGILWFVYHQVQSIMTMMLVFGVVMMGGMLILKLFQREMHA